MIVPSNIIKISSNKPGPTVAVFAGLHGNEMAGVLALRELIPKITITRGTLYLAFANPLAIEAGVRMINKNMNRCFYKGNVDSEPEDIRARELMLVLDKCDALLDLHMFYDNDGLPFVICENDSLDVASKFDVKIVSTNWNNTEPGASDGYMYLNSKIGLCIECGPISKSKEYKDFSIKTVYQFLKYFNMTDKVVSFSTEPKRHVKAIYAIHKDSEGFILKPGFHNFDRLKPGSIIATNKDKKYIAKAGECIVFPHYNARLGEEAYIVGRELNILGEARDNAAKTLLGFE